MTDTQLYLAIGAPIVVNAAVLGIVAMLLIGHTNARFDSLRSEMNARFVALAAQLAQMNQRFDDLRDLWRAELHRVEEVLNARLKHLEER